MKQKEEDKEKEKKGHIDGLKGIYHGKKREKQ